MRMIVLTVCGLALASCSRAITSSPLPPGLPNRTSGTVRTNAVIERPLTGSGYKILFRFNGSDGESPYGGLLAMNGTLYGTTGGGGANGEGTVFKVTSSGSEKVLYSFKGGSDGARPRGSLIDLDGELYGTTQSGGIKKHACTYGCGTVFEINPSGSEKILYSFKAGKDGNGPSSGLVTLNGRLYGTTGAGGGPECVPLSGYALGCGTVFEITASGTERVLHAFKGYPYDGEAPEAGLTVANGELYGTTFAGGSGGSCFASGDYGCGTVFSVTTSGKEQLLHSFKGGSDGAEPEAALMVMNNSLYGTTIHGGGIDYGSVFEVSTSGTERVLYGFKGPPHDGAMPMSPLLAVNGALYGATPAGGPGCHVSSSYGTKGCGIIFAVSTSGKRHILYQFTTGKDGSHPEGGLTAVNAKIYGTTTTGGLPRKSCYHGCGTVFEVTP